MKRNVILSTVAATVVTGVLMMSGCTSSKAEQQNQSYKEEGAVKVVVSEDGSTDSVVTSGGKIQTTVTLRTVSECTVNGVETPCNEVCVAADPCEVQLASVCGPDAKLNYANQTDFDGTFAAWNSTADQVVLDEIADAGTVAAFSGSALVTQTGGIAACDFDFSTFIVCALSENNKFHYWNTSDNSTGYVMVLLEYADGTKEWKKVPITRKFNGEENDQPFIEMLGLNGKMPVKFSVMSILNVGSPATGSSGSSGSIGAGD